MLPHFLPTTAGSSPWCITPHNISHPTSFDFAGISQTYIHILPPNQLHHLEICKVCGVIHIAALCYYSVQRPATQYNDISMAPSKRKLYNSENARCYKFDTETTIHFWVLPDFVWWNILLLQFNRCKDCTSSQSQQHEAVISWYVHMCQHNSLLCCELKLLFESTSALY